MRKREKSVIVKKKTISMFKVIIAGSRKFLDYDFLKTKCDYLLQNKHPNVIILNGGADGADTLGKKYGEDKGYKVLDRLAHWADIEGKPENLIKTNSRGAKYYVLAGHERNQRMADEGDALILFNMGTNGSNDMKERAEKGHLIIKEFKM